jgi:hypothetical protein
LQPQDQAADVVVAAVEKWWVGVSGELAATLMVKSGVAARLRLKSSERWKWKTTFKAGLPGRVSSGRQCASDDLEVWTLEGVTPQIAVPGVMPLEEAVRLEAEDKEAEKPKSEEERLQREWLKRQPIYVSVDALVRLEFPPHIVKWFAEGVPVGVQRSFFERYEKQYPIPAGEATLGAIKEVDRMLSLEVLEEVPSDSLEEVTVVSPWVVVLKSGKTRVCCDVLVNTMIASPAFALPCFRDCLQYLRPDSYVAILDARDFFYAIPVEKESRKYLGVRHPGDQRLLRYARLPMGLASSPFVACSFSEEVAKKLRDMGHKVLVYCDDWAVFGDTKVQCQDALDALQSMLAELQLSVSPHKLKAPSQRQTRGWGLR